MRPSADRKDPYIGPGASALGINARFFDDVAIAYASLNSTGPFTQYRLTQEIGGPTLEVRWNVGNQYPYLVEMSPDLHAWTPATNASALGLGFYGLKQMFATNELFFRIRPDPNP